MVLRARQNSQRRGARYTNVRHVIDSWTHAINGGQDDAFIDFCNRAIGSPFKGIEFSLRDKLVRHDKHQ